MLTKAVIAKPMFGPLHHVCTFGEKKTTLLLGIKSGLAILQKSTEKFDLDYVREDKKSKVHDDHDMTWHP